MSRRQENDARWNIGTFPTKRQRKKGHEIERRCALAVGTDSNGKTPAAKHLRGVNAGKRKECTREQQTRWKQTAGVNVPTTNACGQRAWWKLLRRMLKVLTIGGLAATLEQQRLTATGLGGSCREGVRLWTLANGRVEHPKNRGYVQANGRLQRWNSRGLRPQGLVEAAARKLPRGALGMDALTTEGYAGKRLAKHVKGLKGLKAGKRQAWTP